MAAKFIAIILFCFPLLACVINATTKVFDVTKYGAKPDTDISEALLRAWKEACEGLEPGKIIVPNGNFMLNQVKLEGCKASSIELEVQGNLMAPEDPAQFKEGEWITIQYVERFTLSGGGVFDAQGGKKAWSMNDCNANKKCNKLPYSFSFNFLTNSVIRDVTSKDSKSFHVNVIGCQNLTFDHFKVSAPGDSPNTDGIHIGRSIGIRIVDVDIKTGDDCISIGDGAKQVTIERVTCGPGHGISVGSLGKYEKEEDVQGIFVKNCTLTSTQNGVRVKTWPSSPGRCSVSDLHFEDIVVDNVANPVIIDQEYCPWNQCKLDSPSLVKISQVSIKNIRGTSSTPVVVKLACSKAHPCDSVEVGDIDLTYNGKEGHITTSCLNVKPTFTGKQNPLICAHPAQSS